MLAAGVLLASGDVGGLNGAWAAWALSTARYLSGGKLVLGLATSAFNAARMAGAHLLAAGSVAAWLGWRLGLFALGWVIQFVGHFWEGRKPAFVDDLVGLLVEPMFVVAEWLMALGWNSALAAETNRRAGPSQRGGSGAPVSRRRSCHRAPYSPPRRPPNPPPQCAARCW